MIVDAETGGWRRERSRAAERSGTPESRPQLEELRIGRVGDGAARAGRPAATGPAVSCVVRSIVWASVTRSWVVLLTLAFLLLPLSASGAEVTPVEIVRNPTSFAGQSLTVKGSI